MTNKMRWRSKVGVPVVKWRSVESWPLVRQRSEPIPAAVYGTCARPG